MSFSRSTTPRFKKKASKAEALRAPTPCESPVVIRTPGGSIGSRSAARAEARSLARSNRKQKAEMKKHNTPTPKKHFGGGTTARFKIGGVGSIYKSSETKEVKTATPRTKLGAMEAKGDFSKSTKSRFDGHGSYVHAQRREGKGEVVLQQTFKVKEGPSAAFKTSARVADKWLNVKKDMDEGDHKFMGTRSDFDKASNTNIGKSAVFAAKASRFEGHDSYTKSGQGTSADSGALGMVHQSIVNDKKLGSTMKKGKHSRFSMVGTIYDKALCESVGNAHGNIVKSGDEPSAAFKASSKGRDTWLKVKKDKDKGDELLTEPRSAFATGKNSGANESSAVFAAKASRFEGHDSYTKSGQGTSADSGALGMVHQSIVNDKKLGSTMKKGKHSRFSMVGTIYDKALCESVGNAHGNIVKSGDEPSAAFKASSKGRDTWLKVKKDKDKGDDLLTEPRSAFATGGKSGAKENSAVFAAKASRFEGHDSYTKSGQGTSADSGALGMAHQNLAKENNGGKIMKKGKHGRFSTFGNIYA